MYVVFYVEPKPNVLQHSYRAFGSRDQCFGMPCSARMSVPGVVGSMFMRLSVEVFLITGLRNKFASREVHSIA